MPHCLQLVDQILEILKRTGSRDSVPLAVTCEGSIQCCRKATLLVRPRKICLNKRDGMPELIKGPVEAHLLVGEQIVSLRELIRSAQDNVANEVVEAVDTLGATCCH